MSGGPEEESVGLPTAVGFIGLGAMGKPMVLNLAKGLPPSSRIFVHDVVPAAVDEVHAARPDVVVKCRDARDVTERSVRRHPSAGFYGKPSSSEDVANLDRTWFSPCCPKEPTGYYR
ncbi:hypothetical protein VTK73DRAFT_2250 [Phialemonium thermophilum]|uniref:6-phosphogluconate dehydrogenase NADP-binding domain-containing protein n=1 Tax=Phialemonium thermophilum TaxID=223376 RepID=A0ABR3VSD9_9PEZI